MYDNLLSKWNHNIKKVPQRSFTQLKCYFINSLQENGQTKHKVSIVSKVNKTDAFEQILCIAFEQILCIAFEQILCISITNIQTFEYFEQIL